VRAILRLELIADHYFAYRKYHERINPRYERDVFRMTQPRLQTWVARLSGIDSNGRFEREFVNGMRDYTHANSIGSRGVFIYYPLRSGVYEVNERTGWTKSRYYFIRVTDDGNYTEIGREEVIQCLTNDTSA